MSHTHTHTRTPFSLCAFPARRLTTAAALDTASGGAAAARQWPQAAPRPLDDGLGAAPRPLDDGLGAAPRPLAPAAPAAASATSAVGSIDTWGACRQAVRRWCRQDESLVIGAALQ